MIKPSRKKIFPHGFIAFALTLFLFPSASAQQSYLTAGIGYGFSPALLTEGTGMPYTYNSGGATLGKGMTYGFNIGHMVNDRAGIDLGIWYVAGSSYKNLSGVSDSTFAPGRFSGNTLRIMPSLKLMWGEKHKPYVKLGIILGIATEAQIDDEYNVPNVCVTSPYVITHKFSGGSSSGWFGTFGINFLGEEKTSFFAEVNMCRQNYEPVEETISDCGPGTITYQLVDKPNPANPDEKPKPEFPFSSIGIHAGVKILLGGKNKTAPPSTETAPQQGGGK